MQTRKLPPGHLWIWFDDSGQKLEDKLKIGAAAFRAKFGQCPNVCRLNSCHVDGQMEILGMCLEFKGNILPGDYWFGMEECEDADVCS